MTKAEQNVSEEDAKTLRRRVEYEDQLLNSRTNIVLALNGLMAVAVGLSLPASTRIVAAIIIILINLLWIVCSLDAQRFIRSLTHRIYASGHAPIDELLRKQVQEDRFRIGSTRYMSVVVSILLSVGWVVGLVIAICRPYRRS